MDKFEQAVAETTPDVINEWNDSENCIEWYRGSNTATGTFCQKRMINKIRKYAEQYPDLFQIVSEGPRSIVAHFPVSSIRIVHATPRELSEEEKERARERLEMYRESKRLEAELSEQESQIENEDDE